MNRKKEALSWSNLLSQPHKDKEIKQKEKIVERLEDEFKSVPDIDKAILKSIFGYKKIDSEEAYKNVKSTYELGVDSLLSFAGVNLEKDTVEMIHEFLEALIYDYEQRMQKKNSE